MKTDSTQRGDVATGEQLAAARRKGSRRDHLSKIEEALWRAQRFGLAARAAIDADAEAWRGSAIAARECMSEAWASTDEAIELVRELKARAK